MPVPPIDSPIDGITAMVAVVNKAGLLSHGLVDLRRVALDVAEVGLQAADPGAALRKTVRRVGTQLTVAGEMYDLEQIDHIYVLGAGKASLRIVEALEGILGDDLTDGVVIIPDSQIPALVRCTSLRADHPVPTDRSVAAAQKLLAMADLAGSRDLVIAAVTGGSSALVCCPPNDVSLREKQELHRLLLRSGASIMEVNTVRKHVSGIKGGRLAARAHPARIINLTVSDVTGNILDCITDLTTQDTSTRLEAIEVLQRYELWHRVAPSIREHLGTVEAESPDLSPVAIRTHLLVTGASASQEMAARAEALGFSSLDLEGSVEGLSHEVGTNFARMVRSRVREDQVPCTILGCGGETTVDLEATRAEYGNGGPNMEVALSFAMGLDPTVQVAAVFLDTDGADGGTISAGALVDSGTADNAMKRGIDLAEYLRTHRSSCAFNALGDLAVTGPTYTNVNDLFAIVIAE